MSDQVLIDRISDLALAGMREVMTIPDKLSRRDRKKELKKSVREQLAADYLGKEKEIEGGT